MKKKKNFKAIKLEQLKQLKGGILSTVLKNEKEAQMGITRNIS